MRPFQREMLSCVFAIFWVPSTPTHNLRPYSRTMVNQRSPQGGWLWVYDAWERPFAEVRGQPGGWSHVLLTPQGRDLGAVTWAR